MHLDPLALSPPGYQCCTLISNSSQMYMSIYYMYIVSPIHKYPNLFYRLKSLTIRVLDLYCRHVCLLRPLGEGGKMRVTTDMAQIELALAPFCQKLADLGLPYKKLRLLR